MRLRLRAGEEARPARGEREARGTAGGYGSSGGEPARPSDAPPVRAVAARPLRAGTAGSPRKRRSAVARRVQRRIGIELLERLYLDGGLDRLGRGMCQRSRVEGGAVFEPGLAIVEEDGAAQGGRRRGVDSGCPTSRTFARNLPKAGSRASFFSTHDRTATTADSFFSGL